MKKFPIILDLETKYTFRQYSDPKKLGITVVAVYDYLIEKPEVFLEEELSKLFSKLESASYLVGYNIREFDLAVLQGYYPGDIYQFAVFDILEDIKKKVGKRLALNDLIKPTLNKKKSGHGLMAIEYFKNKEWDKLKKYCLDDVLLTKELFDFGVKNGEIYYLDEKGRQTIKVDWKRYLEGDSLNNNISLTLPF